MEGFYGACFPEEYDGSELEFLNLTIICEEISRVSPGIGSTFNPQAMTVPFTILNWGTEEQIERYVPPLIKGEKTGFFSLTEPAEGRTRPAPAPEDQGRTRQCRSVRPRRAQEVDLVRRHRRCGRAFR